MELLLQQLANGLVIGSTYAVVAIGFALAFTVLRVINFAHPDIFMVGMFAGLLSATQWPALGLRRRAARGRDRCAALVGFALERTVIAPLRGRDVLMTLIGTLGVAIMLQNGMALIAGPDPVAYPGLLPRLFIDIGPVALTLRQIVNFGICLRLAGARQPLRAAAHPMAGRRAPSPSGRTWRRHSASMSAASASSRSCSPRRWPASPRCRSACFMARASAFVGLLYGLKAFICMLVAGNRYFEGVMVVALAHRRHRGAGHRLPVLEPTRRGGVFRADRRALLPAERAVRLLRDLRRRPMNLASIEPVAIFTLLNVAMALGLYITAMSGQLSMATAAIAGVGGYLAAVLTVKFGWPLLPATCLAAIAGALVGTMLALLTLKMRDFILKLTTLAFGEALSVLAFNWEYIGGANSFTGIGLKTHVWTAAVAAADLALCGLAVRRLTIGFCLPRRARRSDRGERHGRLDRAHPLGELCARRRTRRPGRRHPGPLRPGRQPARSRLLRVPELHHLSAVRRPADIVGTDAGCRAAHRMPEMLRFTNEYRLILYGLIIVLVVLRRPDGLLRRNPTGRPCRFFKWNFIAGRPARLPQGGVADRKLPSVLANAPQSRL